MKVEQNRIIKGREKWSLSFLRAVEKSKKENYFFSGIEFYVYKK